MEDINRLLLKAERMSKNIYFWAIFFKEAKNKSIFYIHPNFIVMSKKAFDDLQKKPKIKSFVIIDEGLDLKK